MVITLRPELQAALNDQERAVSSVAATAPLMSHKHFLSFVCSLSVAALIAFFGTDTAAQAPVHPFADIPTVMQKFVDKGEVSGLVTLIADKDRVLHVAAVGKSNLELGRSMQEDDLFWIASMSKPITAICVATLMDAGLLSFDDPVDKFIPEFRQVRFKDKEPDRAITLRDLLTHTSGLGEYGKVDPHATLKQLSQEIAKQPLRFQLGTKWSYSTAGIDTLGRVVEVVSGLTFDEYLQKNLFTPLGMKNTTFWLTAEQEKRFAANYAQTAGKLVPARISFMYGAAVTDRARPPLGGAGLFSTAADVAKVYQMVLNGGSFGGKQILKKETVTQMISNQTGKLTTRPGMAWGLGFCVVTDPKGLEANAMLAPGSFGHGGAHGTNSWVDPQRGIIYILMLQRAGLRNPDNSAMHIEFQEAVVRDVERGKK